MPGKAFQDFTQELHESTTGMENELTSGYDGGIGLIKTVHDNGIYTTVYPSEAKTDNALS